jgi:hypothetical protein
MLMRFFHAHDVLHAHGVNDRGPRFAMENGVHPERRERTELARIHEAEGLTNLKTNLNQKNER